jgi:hypothetical protein
VKFGMGVLYKKLCSSLELRENPHGDSRILRRDVNVFVLVLYHRPVVCLATGP